MILGHIWVYYIISSHCKLITFRMTERQSKNPVSCIDTQCEQQKSILSINRLNVKINLHKNEYHYHLSIINKYHQ